MGKLLRRIARIGCFILLLMAGLVAYWIAGQVRAAGLPITSSFHPFRSAEIRDEFYERYDRLAEQWPVPSETRMVETNYGPTFVRISGNAGAPPLVLLHGVGGNGFQWLDNVEALAEHFRVFTVDNIYDNGLSVNRLPIERSDDFILWMDELFEKLENRRKIHLGGISYGGWLATRYASRRPERLQSLVLLAPVATIQPLEVEWMLRAVLCAIPLRAPTESFMTWLAEDLAASPGGRERISVLAEDSLFSLQAFKPRRMVPPDVLSDEQLSSLGPPTLLLVGENEKIYDPTEVMARMARVAPQVHSELIPDAGHDLSIVRADLVNRLVIDFILGVEADTPADK